MKTMTTVIVVGLVMFYALGTGFIMMSGTNESNDLDVNIIAKANINGSGIFAKPEFDLRIGSDTEPLTQADKDKWNGRVFMTPGAGSIQHYMLNRFAVSDLGLEFKQYSGSAAPGAIYWIGTAPAGMLTFFKANPYVDGGFPWEPNFSEVLMDLGENYKVATSDEIEDGHPCCMVAAKTSFLNANEGAVLRFLCAYTEALDWTNNALANKTSDDYRLLLAIASVWTGKPTEVVSKAFDNLTYLYDLSSGATSLEDYTAKLIPEFEKFNLIKEHVDDPAAFASAFINHRYIDKVKILTPSEKEDMAQSKKVRIRVGHLIADIHQIGLAIGIHLKYFDKYGLDIITTQYSNGPGIMTAFGLGVIDIGILGLPPALYGTANLR